MRHATAVLLQRLPASGARWLWGAKPFGVKLHAPLCEALSVAVLRFAATTAVAGAHAAPLTRPALRVLATCGVAGASMQVCTRHELRVQQHRASHTCPCAQAALLADALSVLALPLAGLRVVATAWMALHLAGISNLWRKLYRPSAAGAQPRTGGGGVETYRVERLTVGALLLTPLLLLAPTLAAYGALIAALTALPAGAQAALRATPAALRALPWGRLAATLLMLGGSRRSANAWLEPVPGVAGVVRLHR